MEIEGARAIKASMPSVFSTAAGAAAPDGDGDDGCREDEDKISLTSDASLSTGRVCQGFNVMCNVRNAPTQPI